MSITLDELLALVGRLDDAEGFDTPRERFRRYLLGHLTDVPAARALIEDCQRSVGEQRHRALQDLIVFVGRLLQFDITFGTYERSAGGVKIDGQWRSAGQLEIVLEVRTEQTTGQTLGGLARAVASQVEHDSRIGLCVVARQYAARGRLDQATNTQFPHLRIVSVRSLLSLAVHVAAGRMSHGDVVRLLRSGLALDFVIDLLDRAAPNGRSSESSTDLGQTAQTAFTDQREPAFWAATITANEMAAPEQLLTSVIAHRRVLAICHAGRIRGEGSPGDWVCFFLANKGIVGHAQLASIIEDSASVVRDAGRFSRVYQLAHVTLYEEPIVQALRGERPFAVPPADIPLAGPCLAPITRRDFLALTTYRDEAASAESPRAATA